MFNLYKITTGVVMDSKCPINELLVVLEALLSESLLEDKAVVKLNSLKHLLTRFTYKESQFIDLSLEKDEYKHEIESILDSTYVRGLGNWKKDDPIHLCHVVNAMVNLITSGRSKRKSVGELYLPAFFS